VALRRNALQQTTTAEGLKRKFKLRRTQTNSIDDPAKAAIHYLRLDEILSLFRDIVDGLEYLHSNGVLHLDVS
jgi:serine/threonine protein kinase